MKDSYRYIGRIPARWFDKVIGSDEDISADDPRVADIKELIKIWNHKGNPDPILDRY